ncbi:CAP domain-containing protein [Sorangium sp. So ce1182]
MSRFKQTAEALAAISLIVFGSSCAALPVSGRTLGARAKDLLRHLPNAYEPDAAQMQGFAPESRLRDIVLSRVPEAARALAHEDAAFNCIASVLAENYPDNPVEPSMLLRHWIAWRCGATSGDFQHIYTSCEGRCTDVYLDPQLKNLASALASQERRFDYGFSRRRVGQWHFQVIVFREWIGEFETRPKQIYAPGEYFTMRLRPSDHLSSPAVYFQAEDGKVTVDDSAEKENGTWEVVHRLPAASGTYFVELSAKDTYRTLGDEEAWRASVLLFPVYVGASKPPAPDSFAYEQTDLRQAMSSAKWLLDRYNERRSTLGRPALKWHEGAAALASTHAENLAQTGQRLPPDEDLSSKLQRIGVSTRCEHRESHNQKSIFDYARLHLLSPRTIATMLDTDATHVGIGIAAQPAQEGEEESYAIVEYWIWPRSRPQTSLAEAGAGGRR